MFLVLGGRVESRLSLFVGRGWADDRGSPASVSSLPDLQGVLCEMHSAIHGAKWTDDKCYCHRFSISTREVKMQTLLNSLWIILWGRFWNWMPHIYQSLYQSVAPEDIYSRRFWRWKFMIIQRNVIKVIARYGISLGKLVITFMLFIIWVIKAREPRNWSSALCLLLVILKISFTWVPST